MIAKRLLVRIIVPGLVALPAITAQPGAAAPRPPFGSPEPAAAGAMTIQAGQRNVVEGQEVWLPIWMTNGVNIANLNYEVRYDARVVTAVRDVKRGSFFGSALQQANTETPGIVLAGYAQTTGENGSGSIAWIKFKAVGRPGDHTDLKLAVPTINDPAGGAPTIDTIDGLIQIVDVNGMLPGDCNGDGSLNADDALCALQMSVKLVPESLVLDIDKNQAVNSRDSALILQQWAGAPAPAPGTPGGPGTPAAAGPALDQVKKQLEGMGTPKTGDAAKTSFTDFKAAAEAALASGVSLTTIQHEIEVAILRALSTPEGTRGLLTTNIARSGQVTSMKVTHGAGGTVGLQQLGGRPIELAAGEEGPIVVYFVNGQLNTAEEAWAAMVIVARTLAFALKDDFRINLVHNFSFKDDITMDAWHCTQRVGPLVGADPIAKQLADQVCRLAAPGLAIGDAASLVEAAGRALTTSLPQLFLQATLDDDVASRAVNETLLDLTTKNIDAGRSVLLVSHSQGGFFLRNALPKLKTHWDESGKGQQGSCQRPAPVGALYIAPPFGSGRELAADPTRYVMLEGDFLLTLGAISNVTPTAVPKPPQQTNDSTLAPLFVHVLVNYLSPTDNFGAAGSESRQQVQTAAKELEKFLENPCGPIVTGVAPRSGETPSIIHIVIAGRNMAGITTVTLSGNGKDVQGPAQSTDIRVAASIPAPPAGVYNVVLGNANGDQFIACTRCFNVTDKAQP